jgi:predicted nuclease of predicted toxin-antitoxin system
VKVLVDMNLTPARVGFFASQNFESLHWSSVGDSRAKDASIMAWAREHGFVVFTHDLDIAALLAHAGLTGPSVIQVRTQDVLPDAIGIHVIETLRDHADALRKGAIVTIDELKARVRVLPIRASV